MTANLQRLGYTEREASFLVIASLQSAYFLRRHFNTFIGRECGALGQNFIDRALRLAHVRMVSGFGNRLLYHVGARAVYAQLGEPDNRNRREHRPDTIRRRLMILDYVIARPAEAWLLTDEMRRDAFARLGALKPDTHAVAGTKAAPCLDDRQPVSLEASGAPTFAFIDAGLRGLSEWERFLKGHRQLLGQIDKAQIVYASCDPTRFQLAENLFRRIVAGEAATGGIDIDRLQGYFRARRLFDERRYEDFDKARLDRLREDQQVYAGSIFERIYGHWREQGDDALLGLKPSRIRFGTHVLSHSYAWLSPIRFQERRP